MAGFCLNYLKILCLTGFLLLGIFSLLIKFEVEAMKVEKERITSGFWISLITSIVYFIKIILTFLKDLSYWIYLFHNKNQISRK